MIMQLTSLVDLLFIVMFLQYMELRDASQRQLHAEATSLLAIIPTVLVGVWRQQSYGNVRWRPALVIGLASVAAAVGGAQLAESLPEHVLRKLFAVLLIAVACQVAWRARRKKP